MKSISVHKEEYGNLVEQSVAFRSNKDNYVDGNIDEGLFTEEALEKFDAMTEGIEAKKRNIDALDRAERQVAPDNSKPVRQTVPATPVDPVERATGGWKSKGEFYSAVMKASRPGNAEIDNRFRVGAAAATTYGNEGTGSDGGFLIPEMFNGEIMGLALEGESLLALTDNYSVTGNNMSFPADETTPWGTSGPLSYWVQEAGAATETKLALKKVRLELYKLMALCPLTDEMLEDSGVVGSYVTRKIAESIRWKTNDAIVNGLGSGTPLGFFKAAALVSQAKVGSQTADTINATNVSAMFARMPADMISSGVWLVNPDAWHQLPLMTIGDKPVWIAPTGITMPPGGLLFGRPVILSQSCQTLGDKGDIFFVNLKKYITITKAGGIKTDMSIHLYFDYGETAFRSTFRIDGKPWMTAAITPPNSAVTMSPFITLDARA